MKIQFTGEMGKCHGELEDSFPEEFKRFVDANAESVAKEVENYARTTTAFKDETGSLRKSIKARKSKYPDGGWIVGAWAPHAWLVEYGHELINWSTGRKIGNVPPKPYLRPALEQGMYSAYSKFRIG